MFRPRATWIRPYRTSADLRDVVHRQKPRHDSVRRAEAYTSTNPAWRKTATLRTLPSDWIMSTLSRTEKAYRGLTPLAFSAHSSADIRYGAPPIMAESAPAWKATSASFSARSATSSFEGMVVNVRRLRTVALSSGSTTPTAFCSSVESCCVMFKIIMA